MTTPLSTPSGEGSGSQGSPVPAALDAPTIVPGSVDWSKPVRTVGRKTPVRIYAIDHHLRKPVVGLVEGDPWTTEWSLSGLFHKEPCGLDLENVPEPAPPDPDPVPVAREEGFRAGFGAGHRRGMDQASSDPMRHNDSPDEDAALAEYLEDLK